jgi:hypothetical protein
MKFITKWFSGLIETAVRKAIAEDQFVSAWIDETVKAHTSAANIDYDELANALIQDGLDYNQIAENISLSDLSDEFDTSEIENKVAEEIETDDIVQKVVDSIDTDDIADQVKENIEIDYSEIEIDYQALGRALVELAASRG